MAIILKEKSMNECLCQKCGSTIGYTDDDICMAKDDYGKTGQGLECPKCGSVILVKEMAQDEWPEAFYYFGDGVHLTDQEIQRYVDECIRKLRNSETDYTYVGSGDTFVVASWDGGSIIVRVCRGYYEAYVDGT